MRMKVRATMTKSLSSAAVLEAKGTSSWKKPAGATLVCGSAKLMTGCVLVTVVAAGSATRASASARVSSAMTGVRENSRTSHASHVAMPASTAPMSAFPHMTRESPRWSVVSVLAAMRSRAGLFGCGIMV